MSTSDQELEAFAKKSVKALLELYEKGNSQEHSRRTVVEQEAEILRGFVRSTKSKFETLTTTSNIQDKETLRKKNEARKEPIPQKVVIKQDESLEQKDTQKPKEETNVEEKKVEEKSETKDQQEVKPEPHKEESKGNKSDHVVVPEISSDAKVDEPKQKRKKKIEFAPELVLEKIKEKSRTEEDVQVQRLQQKLSSALIENETSRIQRLIIEALQKDEDESKIVKYVVKATKSHIPSENASGNEVSFAPGDLFGVIEDSDEIFYKVKTTDKKVAVVPKEFTEIITEDVRDIFDDDNHELPSPVSPTPSMDLESRSWVSFAGEKAMSFSKEDRSRQEAIYEVISTEDSFVRDMSMVSKSFLAKLKSKVDDSHITEEDLQLIFSNLDEIIKYSEELSNTMKKLQDSNDPAIENFGQVIKDQIDGLRVYAPFCSNLKRSLAHLKKKKTNPAFKEVFEECEKSFSSQLNLESYLLKPMQRVTKWPLLIKGIIKYTPEGHEDKPHLEECLKSIENSVWHVNNECGKVDERMTLDALQEQLNSDLGEQLGNGFLSSANRKLLREGPLQRVNPDMKVRAFLFNDLLILTKEDKERSKFKLYVRPILLWMIDVQFALADQKNSIKRASKSPGSPSSSTDLLETNDDRTFILNDQGTNSIFDLRAATKREKTLWLEDIGIALKSLKHDSCLVIRVADLKEKGDNIEVIQSTKFGDQFLIATEEGMMAVSGGAIKRTSFKKKAQIFQVLPELGQFVILEGKSGAIRVYPMAALDGADAPPLKMDTKEIINFKVGKVQEEYYLATFSTKLQVFQNKPEGYTPSFEIFIPGNTCESINLINGEFVVGSGQKFYSISVSPPRLTEIVPHNNDVSPSSVAKTAFSLNGDVLMCFSDVAIWKDSSNPSMKWSFTAKSFVVRGEFLFVFVQNYIEIWSWKTSQLIQAMRAFNSRCLNPDDDQDKDILVSVTFPPNNPCLCKIALNV